MAVGAAIRITSNDVTRVIEHASLFAQGQSAPCFVFSVVGELPYGAITADEHEVVRRNLELIAAFHASPVMQEGSDVAGTLVSVAEIFGVRTLFVQNGLPGRLGRSIAERLLYLKPSFDVVVVASNEG